MTRDHTCRGKSNILVRINFLKKKKKESRKKINSHRCNNHAGFILNLKHVCTIPYDPFFGSLSRRVWRNLRDVHIMFGLQRVTKILHLRVFSSINAHNDDTQNNCVNSVNVWGNEIIYFNVSRQFLKLFSWICFSDKL